MPVVLDVRGARVLVVGARPAALEKARIALSFGARVRLYADSFPVEAPDLDVEAEEGPYDAGLLAPRVARATLVFCDTGDEAADALVSRLARERRVPVNVVDKTSLCTFIMPAYVRGKSFALAITTFGASPMASRLLREELESDLAWVDAFVELQAELRRRLLDLDVGMEERARRLRAAGTDGEVREALLRGDLDAARRRAAGLAGVQA